MLIRRTPAGPTAPRMRPRQQHQPSVAFSSEFRNGGLRISLTAVPRRGLFHAAKLSVIGGLTLGVGLVTGVTTFLPGQALRGESGRRLPDPGALRAALGSGVYLALMAPFARA